MSRATSIVGLWARVRRKSPTPAERAVWQAIRRAALGVRFRRQVLVRGASVDFYCATRRLVVEVDLPGPVVDARRDRRLARRGIGTLRVTTVEVLEALPTVLERIRAALRARQPETVDVDT